MTGGSRNNVRKEVMLLHRKQAAVRSIGDQREDWEECIPFQMETDDYAELELFGWNIL